MHIYVFLVFVSLCLCAQRGLTLFARFSSKPLFIGTLTFCSLWSSAGHCFAGIFNNITRNRALVRHIITVKPTATLSAATVSLVSARFCTILIFSASLSRSRSTTRNALVASAIASPPSPRHPPNTQSHTCASKMRQQSGPNAGPATATVAPAIGNNAQTMALSRALDASRGTNSGPAAPMEEVAGAQDTIYLCNFRVSVDGEWLCLKELQDMDLQDGSAVTTHHGSHAGGHQAGDHHRDAGHQQGHAQRNSAIGHDEMGGHMINYGTQ